MTKETLERLLNQACELLIIFENSGYATSEELTKIDAIFNEIKYADEIDNEMNVNADEEAQNWEVFGKNKI